MCCEGVPLRRIAGAVGTPTFVYSLGTILHHYRRLTEAFAGTPTEICYSVKANGNLAILSALAREGSGFDIVSSGELYRVRRAGGDVGRVVFAGVGKTDDEIAMALRAGIRMFNVESWPEAERINAVAGAAGKTARVAFRLNPDVDAHTHAHITTGKSENKFGLPIDEAPALFDAARRRFASLQATGIHMHIGSQITEVGPYRQALRKGIAAVRALRGRGHVIRSLNLGGGLGIVYDKETPATAQQFAATILPMLRGLDLELLLEPGRFIVGNAGVLIARVIYVKEAGRKTFAIVDGGMNDLIRPSLYSAYHQVLPMRQAPGRKVRRSVDVVGPICESADFLAKDRRIATPRSGEYVIVRSTGAFGFVMSSNYNARPRAAEVLVKGSRWDVVRRRETHADLVRGETIPAFAATRPGRRRTPR
jgi:diaminopimelate decarboxylase